MARKKPEARRQEQGEDFGFQVPAAPTETEDLLDQLTAGADDDPEAVELSDQEKANLGVCYQTVAHLTRKKRKLEAEVSDVSAALTAAKESMMTAMEAQGTTQFRGAQDDGACSKGIRYNTKVTDPVLFIRWVMANHPDLLTINSQARTKFIRENYKDKGIPVDSKEFPPGIEAKEDDFLQVRGVKDLQPKEAN